MTDTVHIPHGTTYKPGEPYEFMMPLFKDSNPVLRYRCFRGGCRGGAVMVADRNTHNGYHNKREQ